MADVTGDPLAVCEAVTKRYGAVTALDSLDLGVQAGRVHCLAGPNGSGKSTLLGVLAGLVRPDAGSVRRDASVGVGFQRPRIYGELTVAENLSVFAGLVGADRQRREAAVAALGLEPVRGRRASALSDGYARKLDVALALLGDPELLLLDEPLVTLDDHTADQLRSVVAEYPGECRAVVVASHDIDRFDGVLDRLTVLDDGRVVLDRDLRALDAPPQAAYVEALREGSPG